MLALAELCPTWNPFRADSSDTGSADATEQTALATRACITLEKIQK